MSKLNRKKKQIYVLSLLLVSLLALNACGDDLSVRVPVLSYKDIEETVGSENQNNGENRESGGNQKDSVNQEGSESGENLQGGENQTGSADRLESKESSEPQKPEPVTITISAAGDASLGNHQGQDYYFSFRQEYDKAENAGYFLENVYDIFSKDDMTILNLEGTLTYSEKLREGQTFCIKGDPEYAKILTYGSVEAVGMANNHRLDYLEQGAADTVKAVEEEGIVYAYDNNVGIYETKGIRIGFVSVNEVGMGAGVEKILQEGIEKLKEEGTDIILACCHWGIEREYYPEDYQKKLGRKCIDWGADLVIGHHPHVLQGIEEYQGKYIVYSLGNFCFGANRNPADKDCMIFQQTFTFVEGEKQEEAPIRVIPCSVSSVSDRNDFKPTPAQGEEALRIIDKINNCSLDFGVQFDEEGYRISDEPSEGNSTDYKDGL